MESYRHTVMYQRNYQMGANRSTFPTDLYVSSFPTARHAYGSPGSQVRSFHTTNEWNNYLNNTKESNQLTVIDFTASWCAPCKFIEPTFQVLAAKFTDVVFAKIDVDELVRVAHDFGVEAMPTFLLIKQGKEVDRIQGAKKDELEKKIEKHRGTTTKFSRA